LLKRHNKVLSFWFVSSGGMVHEKGLVPQECK